MTQLAFVLRVVGWSLVSMALALLPVILVDLYDGLAEWKAMAFVFFLTGFVAVALLLGVGGRSAGQKAEAEMQSIILGLLAGTAAIITIASVPFMVGATQTSMADGLFEGVARITTSGGTVFAHLSDLSPGLLLWRGLLQWLGGAFGLILGLALLPFLQVGGMAFFRIDVFAGLEPTRRSKRMAASFAGLYVGLTGLLIFMLWGAGMTPRDALLHAFALISCGGASPWSSSLGHYDQGSIDLVIVFGMILGGMPFSLLLAAVRGNLKALYGDAQVQWYLAVMLLGALGLSWWAQHHWGWSWSKALRQDGMAVVSAETGSGLSEQSSFIWNGFPAVILLFLTTLGGCAGSTAGGLKIFRFQAVLSEIWVQLGSMLRPHAVRTARVDGRVLYRSTRNQIMGYVFIYVASFAALAWGLGALGVDSLTSIAASVSALANADLTLGAVVFQSVGYGALPDSAKVLLCIGMVFGRLEILPILVIFTQSFWRK